MKFWLRNLHFVCARTCGHFFSEKNNISFHLETAFPLTLGYGRTMQILTRCAFQINAPTSPWSQWKLEKFGSLPKDFSRFSRSSLRYHETWAHDKEWCSSGNEIVLQFYKCFDTSEYFHILHWYKTTTMWRFCL